MMTTGRSGRADGRRERLQRPRQRRSVDERDAARALDRRAVRHRVGKRDADFEDVARRGHLANNAENVSRAGKPAVTYAAIAARPALLACAMADVMRSPPWVIAPPP